MNGKAVADMPDLVSSESDEEEEEYYEVNNAKYVKKWYTLGESTLKEEAAMIREQTLGPFLFGFRGVVPIFWISALHVSGALAKEREKNIGVLEDWEIKIADFVDVIIRKNISVIKDSTKKDILRDIMAMVNQIEKNSASTDEIDVGRAIDTAMRWTFFSEAWNGLEFLPTAKKYKRAALFCLVYFFKKVHHHVYFYGRDSVRASEAIQKEKITPEEKLKALEMTHKGRVFFKHKDYQGALDVFSHALKWDCLNYHLYEHRTEVYFILMKYREAFCDCKRIIFLNERSVKGYYWYAEVCLKLGCIEEAYHHNKKGLKWCSKSDPDTCMKLEGQKEKIAHLAAPVKIITAEQSASITDTHAHVKAVKREVKSESEDVPVRAVKREIKPDPEHDHVRAVKREIKTEPEDSYVKEVKREVKIEPVMIVKPEVEDSEKYRNFIRDALDALHNEDPVRACSKFQSAYDLWNHNQQLKSQLAKIDVTVLKYAYGITAVSQETTKRTIQDGLEIFMSMYKEGKGDNFPLVYYGLGRAHMALYRFSDALEFLKVGVDMPKKLKGWNEVRWPQSEEVIEESKLNVFKSSMEKLLTLCRYPPPPDVKCSIHSAHDNEPVHIYFNSPAFSGYIQMHCHMKCRNTFHLHCWKVFKSSFSDRHSDKEMLNQSCPTPDCNSIIVRLIICRPGYKLKELISANCPKKPASVSHKLGRMSKSNPDKIAKKIERKEIRRQKRQEAREAIIWGKQDIQDAEKSSKTDSGRQENKGLVTMPTAAAMTVLKRDDEEDIKYQGFQKPFRLKKKKEKVKHVLNVEVNFTDRKEEVLLGAHSVADDSSGSPENAARDRYMLTKLKEEPFAVPLHLQPQVQKFALQQPSILRDKAIAENLFEFFGGILREQGPLHLNSPILQQELRLLPDEAKRIVSQAGGPYDFFRRSLKFAVIDNIVANIQDARRAHEMSKGLHPSVSVPTMTGAYITNKSPSTHLVQSLSCVNLDSKYSQNSVNQTLPISSISGTESRSDMWLHEDEEQYSDSEIWLQVSKYSEVDDADNNEMNGIESGTHHKPENLKESFKNYFEDIRDISQKAWNLNPTAPEFQPGKTIPFSGKKEEMDNLNEKTDSSLVTDLIHSRHHYDSLENFNFVESSLETSLHGLDDIDEFTGPSIQTCIDVDLDNAHVITESETEYYSNSTNLNILNVSESHSNFTDKNKLNVVPDSQHNFSDKSELNLVPKNNNFTDKSELNHALESYSNMTENEVYEADNFSFKQTGEQDKIVTSSRSSPDDLSQTSDISMGKLFWTSSSNSPVLSGRTASAHDLSFPGARDSASPKSQYLLWRNGSPDKQSGSLGISLKYETLKDESEDLLNDLREESKVLQNEQCDSGSKLFPNFSNIVNSYISSPEPVPRPLRPLAQRTDNIITSKDTHSSKSSSSSSLMHATELDNSSWSSTPWPSNTFPSAVRPDEDMSHCISTVNFSTPFQQEPHFDVTVRRSPHLPQTIGHSTNHFALSHVPGGDNLWSDSLSGAYLWREKQSFEEMTQVETEVRSVQVNTDLDVGAVLALNKQLFEENEKLKQQIQVVTDQKSNLESTCQKYEDMKVQLELEAAKSHQEADVAIQKMNSLEANFSMSLKIYEEKERSLLEMMKELEGERSFYKLESERCALRKQELDRKLQTEEQRAKTAEIEVVRLRLQLHLKQLEHKQREAESHQYYASTFAKRCQEKGEVSDKVQETLANCQAVIRGLNEEQKQIRQKYEELLNKVQAGLRLSDLPLVSISPPPDHKLPEGIPLIPPLLNGQSVLLPDRSDHQHYSITAASSAFALKNDNHTSPSPGPFESVAMSAMFTKGPNPHSQSDVSLPKPLALPISMGRPVTALRPALGQLPSHAPILATAIRPQLRPPLALPTRSSSPSMQTSQPSQQLKMAEAVHNPRILPNNGVRIVSLGQAPGAPRTSFDKLVATLQKSFPTCTREDFAGLIQELRRLSGGSLSGMSLEIIVTQLTHMAISQGFRPSGNAQSTPAAGSELKRTTLPPPGLNPAWSVEGLDSVQRPREWGDAVGSDQYEEDPCAICHEELSSAPVATLDCRHQFHDQCVRLWLREQNTCPNCRVHTLLQDEFPALK